VRDSCVFFSSAMAVSEAEMGVRGLFEDRNLIA
jgi:hypothetical protein